MRKTAPCYNCEKRYLGCHDYCNEYQEFNTNRKAFLKMRMKQNKEKYDYLDYKYNAIKRMTQ